MKSLATFISSLTTLKLQDTLQKIFQINLPRDIDRA
jgi:hypothetical protein